MDPFHFACPHCSSRLRVREKLYVGRQVDCPECGDLLLIVERPDGLGVERIERAPVVPAVDIKQQRKSTRQSVVKGAQANAPDRASQPVAAVAPNAQSGPSGAAAQSPVQIEPNRVVHGRRPLILGLGAAAIVLGGALSLVFFPPTTPLPPASEESPTEVALEPGHDLALPGPGENSPHPDDAQKISKAEQPPDAIETRLSTIGKAILEYVERDKAFPAGTVAAPRLAPENRLSWMALLADHLDEATTHVPVWDKAWNDPQNETFVRRRLTAFQNPAIGQLVGADGYPAAHFVGVAGVGSDAASLDHRHPRAGVFGYDRRTRLDDIRDGAANTLLVMGVHDHLGSWAAGGTPTVRGLSREPYMNGPDGFGTGGSDSMLVLMADGRVLSVNKQTDPKILRRMAAKSDGLPLDESEPGEPADRLSLVDDNELQAGNSEMAADQNLLPGGALAENVGKNVIDDDDEPIDPEFAPEGAGPAVPPPRKIDLAVSLKQPIVRFDQPRSKPLEEVLTSVAEMAGTRIAYDRDELGPAGALLNEPMALRLDNTTVGDILSGLLRPVGLSFRIEGDHLRLVRAE